MAVGLVVSALRGDTFGGHVAVPMYQSLIVLGAILTYIGVLRFLGQTRAAGMARWAVACLHRVGDRTSRSSTTSATLRTVAFYVTVAVVLGATSAALWRYRCPPSGGPRATRRPCSRSGSLTYLVLAAAEPSRTQVVDVFYAPSPVNAGAFLAAIATTVLWTFGLVMMINQRLAAEIALDARNMHSVFATSPDCAIISRRTDGIIDDVNEGFTRCPGSSGTRSSAGPPSTLGLWVDPSVRDADGRATSRPA